MKVIDILNKIANDEKIPHFKVSEVEYYLNWKGNLLEREEDKPSADVQWFIDKDWLNTEVEIIEEDKKIERIQRIQSCGDNLYSEYIGQWLANKENYTEYVELLMNKINEIIDYLNKENK